MSLFGDDRFQWRETYFVLFRERDRPDAKQAVRSIVGEDGRFDVSNVRADSKGKLESLTLTSPDDFAAMDISYVAGDEVSEQVEELTREVAQGTLTGDEREKLKRLAKCDARFDIFHFEQRMLDGEDGDDEFLDPAALLIVMDRLSRACGGVAIDPQSGSFM
jgi:hypothetical protein